MEKFITKDKKFISVIIHVKENHNHLVSFLNILEKQFSPNFENYEYIIVNNSANLDINQYLTLQEKNNISGSINIINLSWVHNIEDAMRAGIDLSIGDFIFEFDSISLDFNSSFILEVYKICLEGFDVVAAVPLLSKFSISKLFYNILSRFSNNIELTTETFRVVSRKLLNIAAKSNNSFRYRKINYHYSGLKSKILFYQQIKTFDFKKDFSFSEKFSLAGNVLIYYSNIGTSFSWILSLIFFLASILVGIYTLISFLVLKENIQEGWTTTMLFLSLSFSGLFGILAIISKYLEILLKETKINSSYTYQSIETYKK